MFTRCSRRTKRFQGHRARCGAEVLNFLDNSRGFDLSRYSLNQRVVLATNLLGTSHCDAIKFFKFLGVNLFSFPTFKRIEQMIGEKGVKVIAAKARHKALKEEIHLTKDTYKTTKHGILPALVVSLDMAWLKRASGRRYDSPSGVLHVIGAKTGKILYSVIYKNQCFTCEVIDTLVDKLESGETSKEEKEKIETEIHELRTHECVKNFDGHSKAMESDAIAKVVSEAPTQLGAYIRVIVLDDDTTTRAQLQEDLGPTSAGRLEKCLAGIRFVADPSHRKRTVQKHLFKLVGGIRTKGWALKKDQAKNSPEISDFPSKTLK